ncbi:hypothetical protein BDN67DRAFT_998669 [Paxillus ammoniavirescens]|nr:hypothetical protein BDN67DRAFT_998669 [Paxillus ammoniavirescens]
MSTSSYVFQSPSVSDEKGAYRMRAPRSTRPGSNLRHPTNARQPEPLSQNRKLVVLIAVLTFGMFVCFGTAYYLFTTRWNSQPLSLHVPAADDIIQVALFDESDALLEQLRADPTAMYLAYLPHSGFHNQRISFENALVLSRLLNRTLLVPPIRLGSKTIRYVQFDKLRHFLTLGGKEGLKHCVDVPKDIPMPDECLDYFDYTLVPWEWLVDLTEVKAHQRLVQISNYTSAWLFEKLNISQADTLVLPDSGPYDFRFLDSANDVSPSRHKYLKSVYIPDLVTSQERLLQLGTLFGSSRLRLKQEENKQIRRDVRRSMAFANPDLALASDLIHDALGGVYLGAHVRVGDGHFQRDGRANARLIWWKLVQGILGFDLQTALSLEHQVSPSTDEDEETNPPSIYPDLPSLRVPHPPLAPLPDSFLPRVSCRGRLHRAPSLGRLNVPLFIATDSTKPHSDPLLAPFFKTFPCVFVLSDFPNQTAHLDRVRNGYDGVRMKAFLLPLLDAMVVGKASEVIVTDESTFSAFIGDVLWRTYHGWEIVQRG